MELERVLDSQHHIFSIPAKKINDGDDLHFFFTSTAYRDLSKWLLQLNRAVFPRKQPDGTILKFSVGSVTTPSKVIRDLQSLSTKLSDLIQLAPPDTGPRRFGNVAFRKWYQLAEESAAGLIELHLGVVLTGCEDRENLVNELRAYLLGAFGSAQRLDYGTGHELSFLAFLGCLWKLNAFESGEEAAVVLEVIQPYLKLVRKLIMTYTLEPAGSHGVWGLDDHSFIPYIFGSAQLGPAIAPNSTLPTPTEGSLDPAPPPSSVTSKPTVAEYRDSNMYFSAINFIYEVKRGPFWEHSPVLYDVSGITDGWAKINKGMLKMYVAEVLGKFPVVQHFPFGSLFRWEADPDAIQSSSSSSSSSSTGNPHARAQPPAMQSRDVPPPAPGRTSAPWGTGTRTGRGEGGGTGISLPSRQAPAGTASTRAPWASAPGSAGVSARSSQSMTGEQQLRGVNGMPPTTAPWAKRDPES